MKTGGFLETRAPNPTNEARKTAAGACALRLTL
jgi:hypothetical protein